ncbi:MAG: hypothetical protein WDA09_08015 [Bacteriovoracaceae bacterium]
MKTLIIFYIVFSATLALAQSTNPLFNDQVTVTKSHGGKIFLEGKSCTVLDREGKALEQWAKSVNDKTENKSCSCKNGLCHKEVTAQLPDFAEAFQFEHVSTDGPNCWNATLVAAKIVPQVRYTSDFEMNFWMNSPLCKERAAGEKLKPGDIIAIRSKKQPEVHGFVHISENLSFSKNGFNKNMPYSLQDPNSVFNIYNVPPECRRRNGTPDDCETYANYFSCISMDEYLKKNPIQDKLASDAFNQLTEIECAISDAILSGRSRNIKSLVTTTLAIIHRLSYDTISQKKYDPDDLVIWQALFHKSRSLKDQLTLL